MADPAIEKFTQIGGNTLGERYKNYNNLIKELAASDPKILAEFLARVSSLKKDVIQEIWYIKALNVAKAKDKMLELLRADDKWLRTYVIKNGSSLFEEILREMPVDQVVNEFLPLISSVIRTRLLRKLSRHSKNRPQLAEEYFRAINNRYGIAHASVFIPYCAYKTVVSIVQEYYSHLKEASFNAILRNHPTFYDFIFDYVMSKPANMVFSFPVNFNLNHYLRNRDKFVDKKVREKYFKIVQGESIGFNYSRRIIKKLKDEVINEPENYKFLRDTAIGRCLSIDELVRYYQNILPKNFGEITRESQLRLKIICQKPLHARYDLLTRIIREKYACDLIDQTRITEMVEDWSDVIALMPANQREAMFHAYKALNQAEKCEEYTYLLAPEKVYEIAREKVHLQKEHRKRVALYDNVFKACNISCDFAFMATVLKHIVEKHKNEQSDFFIATLENIKSQFSRRRELYGESVERLPVKLLSTCHMYFYQLVQLATIGGDSGRTYRNILEYFINEILFFKLENEINYDDELKMMKILLDKCYYYGSFYYVPDLVIYRPLLYKIYDLIDKTEKDHVTEFVRRVQKYNAAIKLRRLQSKIKFIDLYTDFPNVITMLKEEFDTNSNDAYSLQSVFEALLMFKTESPLRKIVLDIFWNHYIAPSYRYFNSDEVFMWLLKHEPLELANHITEMYNSDLFLTKHFIRCTHKYEFLGITEKFSQEFERCSLTIDKDTNATSVITALKWYSFTEKFPEKIRDLLPNQTSETIDLEDLKTDEYRLKVDVQTRIPTLFKNYRYPLKLLDATLKFMGKDYKKFGLGGLYTILYNLPEKDVERIVRENFTENCGVSVKKHVIYVALQILSNHARVELLTNVLAKETNQSLRSYLLAGLFRMFRAHPTRETLQSFITNLKLIATKPEMIESEFFNLKLIPKSELNAYTIAIFDIVKAFEGSSLKQTFLNSLDMEEMASLSDSLCDELVTFGFYNSNQRLYGDNETSRTICLNYVFGAKDIRQKTHRIAHVIKLMEKIGTGDDLSNYSLSESVRFEMIRKLCERFYCDTTSIECEFKEIISTLKEFLAQFDQLQVGDFNKLRCEVYLTHAIFFQELIKSNSNVNQLDLGKLIDQISNFFKDKILDDYGKELIHLYSEFLKGFLWGIVKELFEDKKHFEVDILEHFMNVIEKCPDEELSRSMKVLIISLLPNQMPHEKDDIKDRYFVIIDKIKKFQGKIFQFAFTSYLKRIA